MAVNSYRQFCFAAQQFLGAGGLRGPEDVSRVCTDPDPAFAWAQPPLAHIAWDFRLVMRCAAHWGNKVSRGKGDRIQALSKARFIEGGTVGPFGQ